MDSSMSYDGHFTWFAMLLSCYPKKWHEEPHEPQCGSRRFPCKIFIFYNHYNSFSNGRIASVLNINTILLLWNNGIYELKICFLLSDQQYRTQRLISRQSTKPSPSAETNKFQSRVFEEGFK